MSDFFSVKKFHKLGMGLNLSELNKENLQTCPTCKKEVSTIKKETDEFGKVINYFSCGHKLYFLTVKDTISIGTYEMIRIKKMGNERFSKKHKYYYEADIGERIGKDGKSASIRQEIDRVNNRYKKLVKQGDKVIKNIEGELTEHN